MENYLLIHWFKYWFCTHCIEQETLKRTWVNFCDQGQVYLVNIHRHTSFYCIMQEVAFFFFKWIKGLWQPDIEQVYQHHFSRSIYSVCVSRILVILKIFPVFSLWCLLQWSVISGLWYRYDHCFGAPRTKSL